MDFQLSEDQSALQEGVRAFCAGRLTTDQLRALETTGFDAELWRELAELGVFSLRVPEEAGGVGLGSVEAVLVFEELGRCLAPGPLLWSHLAAGRIDGAQSGGTVVTGLDLIGAPEGPYLIEHLANADVVLVLRPEGVERLDPAALDATPVGVPLDPFTPLHHAPALPRGETIGSPSEAAALRLEGAALAAAALLGISQATLTLALDYAKKREQFGRAIGSFQAIKHMFADMFVRQEAARAAVWAAAATLDDPMVGDVLRAVCAAKLLAGDAAMKNARKCIQIHGGMGYTWEVPAHYYLKRTWVLENVFGTVDDQADRVGLLLDADAA